MSDLHLDERFNRSSLAPTLKWFNQPPSWSIQTNKATLLLQPAAPTDFWQQTHYGFRADSGHLLYLDLSGDFVMSTQVRSHPVHQYDQAGLMVRLNSDTWIKTSVEHETDRPPQLGAVVTNHGYSDWSLQDFTAGTDEVRLQIRRQGDDFLIDWATTASLEWRPLRVAHLHGTASQPLRCGLYACSPKAAGFQAEFRFLKVSSTN